jgi:hypothetical protein
MLAELRSKPKAVICDAANPPACNRMTKETTQGSPHRDVVGSVATFTKNSKCGTMTMSLHGDGSDRVLVSGNCTLLW